MANIKKRVPENVAGDFFVDSTCINCDACRQIAPSVFGEAAATSFVHTQPVSSVHRRHALQGNFVWELPVGKGKRFLGTAGTMLDRALGGWELTGLGRITSGRPFTVFSGSNTVSNVNQSTANCSGCAAGAGSPFLDSASGLIWYFDPALRAKFSAPGAGEFGNTGRNAFVGPHYAVLDTSVLKRIALTEKIKLELRADATNLTNSVMFGAPTTDITSGTFGRIRSTVTSGSRKIQIGAKIHF